MQAFGRPCLSIFICFGLISNELMAAPPDRVDKIRTQVSQLPGNAEVEIRLLDTARLKGHIERFDDNQLFLAGRAQSVKYAEIGSIKQVRGGPVWNPATGFARSLTMIAVVIGGVIIIGVIAAKNTR